MDQDVQPNPNEQGKEVEKGSVPPGHVPLERLNEVLGKVSALETQLARTQGQVEGMATKPADPVAPTQTYTRAQLDAAVAGNQISQADADARYEQQIVDRAKKEAAEEASQTLAAANGQNLASSDLALYRAARPDIQVEGSKDRGRVQQEYAYLTSRGHPDNLETQALALRQVFGPAENLKNGTRQTHQETGGGGGEPPEDKGSDWPKDMSSDQKWYYKDQIAKGSYTKDTAVQEWTDNQKRKAA